METTEQHHTIDGHVATVRAAIDDILTACYEAEEGVRPYVREYALAHLADLETEVSAAIRKLPES